MRIGLAALMHESNTFVARTTTRKNFHAVTGDDLVAQWKDSHHELAGFLEGADRFDFEAVPLLAAGATPGGPVADEVLRWWIVEFSRRWLEAGRLDGLLLALHGAMVAQSFPDGDGEVARRVRSIIGDDRPLVITHDFHANLSAALVACCHALVVYQTNPHVDQRACGLRAAEILARTLRDEVRPTTALAKPPMIWNILHQNTSRAPLQAILEAARNLEQQSGVLSVSVVGGYQYADVPEVGPSVVVVTDGDAARAQREAEGLARALWDARGELAIALPDARASVRQATEQPLNPEPRTLNPVVLVDMGDNIGGGSPGDSTILLQELIEQNAEGWLVVLCDPEAVQQCAAAGVGAVVSLRVGGKTDLLHGMPVEVTGRVVTMHAGHFEEPEPRHGGRRFNEQGETVVVEISNRRSEVSNRLVLNSLRTPPFSLQQLISLGLDPRAQKIIVVKAAIAFRAAYEPVAGRIVEVDTPGVTAVNPLRFTYRQARRPLWPLDEVAT